MSSPGEWEALLPVVIQKPRFLPVSTPPTHRSSGHLHAGSWVTTTCGFRVVKEEERLEKEP